MVLGVLSRSMAIPKKKINQDDLRKLMKERRENLKSSESKINSAHAKYNNIGQLHCVLCNMLIKNENLWSSHVLSKSHKQNIEIAKQKEHSFYKPEPVHCNNGKRKAGPSSTEPKKPCIRGKESIVVDQALSDQRINPPNSSAVSQLNVLQGYSSSEEESEGESDKIVVPTPASASIQEEILSGNLPPGFFDEQPQKTSVPVASSPKYPFTEPSLPGKAEKKEKPCSGTHGDPLPEGFFDDPVLDAKARNVEYKDPMEGEWEKFQKTIAEESNVSEAIMQEDVEESTAERDIDQIDQQIYNWSIVEKLQSKVDKARLAQNDKESPKSSENEDEEEEYEDLLKNWRAKAVWKH